MNKIETVTIANYQGVNDECARFIIDNPTKAFKLNNIATVDQEYTFSAWIKFDKTDTSEYGDVFIHGATFRTSSSWQKFNTTFVAVNNDVSIFFGTVGTYYIYQPQLEIGNTMTAWVPAPEDTDADIASVESKRAELEGTVAGVKEKCDALDDDVKMHFIMDDGGLVIKAEDKEGVVKKLRIKITNELIGFYDSDATNAEPIAFWDGDLFYTGNIHVRTTESARFGNFAFYPRSDGSLSFWKVGD